MIPTDEAAGQYQRPLLDPREPPPQILKDVFKHFQKLHSAAVNTDCEILDFDRDISSHKLEICDNIAPETLAHAYEKFMEDGINLPQQESRPIYSSKSLPGLFILPSFLPPFIQKELMSRLLHRDLSDLVHQTNVHLFHDLPYPQDGKSFFTYPPTSTVSFTPKDPSTHKPFSVPKFLNKSLRWCTLGGQYDWTAKMYPSAPPPQFPSDISDLLSGLFPQIKSQAAIVNLYSPGDTLSLHRDVSEESDKGLVSVSLGCDCLFVVGLGKEGGDYFTVRLRSGDAVVMSQEARWAWHGVPKILKDTCPKYLEDWPAQENGQSGEYDDWRGWMKGKRVNLNVRQMFD